MPAYSSPDLVTLRSFPQPVKRYLSIAPRNSVFNCQVNGTPPRDAQSNGLFRFNYDNASGTSGNALPGMTVDIGTSLADRSIGSLRMRKAIAGSQVFIEETAYGKAPIEDDHYASVIEEFLPAPKLPRLVGIKNNAGYINSFTEYHDYDDSYNAENVSIQPQANITISNASRRKPTPAGWMDANQTYRTVTFSSFFSFAIRTGATIATILWNMKDGTYTVGSSSTSNITVRFPVGYRVISLTITDTAGTSHTQYFPVWAHDESYPPLTDFEVNSDNRDDGREMEYRFFGADNSAAETVIPKLSTVCYWEDAQFDGEEPPVEYLDSFLGWTTDESTTVKLHNRSEVTFKAAGIAFWLSSFPGFGQKVSVATTVNRWFKVGTITIDRMVHYILREYSTALSICNFYWSGDATTVRSEEIKKSDIWNQCVEMAKGNYSSLVADSLNGIWMRQHYSYMELADRGDVDIIANLTNADWTDSSGLSIAEDYQDKVSIVTGTGSFIYNSKNRQIYSKAPGLVPAHSGGTEDAPYQRLPGTAGPVSQAYLNQLTGHHYARVNNLRGEVSISLIGNLDGFEKAWGEPITLTWSEDSIRGTILNTSEFLITKVSVTHSNQRGTPAKKITLTLEEATLGLPGVAYTPPGSPAAPIPTNSTNYPGINLPTYSPAEWYNIPSNAPRLTAFTRSSSASEPMYSLENTQDSKVEWVHNVAPTNGFGISQVIDPFSPLYLGTGSTVNGWALSTLNFTRMTDVFTPISATVTTTPQTSHPVTFEEEEVSYNSHPIVASRVTQNFVMAVGYYHDTGPGDRIPYLCRTTDGVNWTYDNTTLPTIPWTDPHPFYRIDISARVAGLVYVSGAGELWESTDYGVTFTDIAPALTNLVGANFTRILHVPFAANPNSRRFYFAADGIVGVGPGPSLLTPVQSGNTLNYYDIDTDTVSPLPYPPAPNIALYYKVTMLTTCDTDPTRIAALMWPVAQDIDGQWTGAAAYHAPYMFSALVTSRNGGRTWLDRGRVEDADSVQIATTNSDFLYIFGQHAQLLPFGDPSLPYGSLSFIAVSKNFGKDIIDGSRNLVDFTAPEAEQIRTICGGL